MTITLMKNLTLRLPEGAATELSLKEGDELNCTVADGVIYLTPTGDKPQPLVRAVCFGQFNLFMGGVHLPISNKKARELLAYLICESGGPVNKTSLAETLWPDVDAERAMESLYKVCSYFKKSEVGKAVPLTIGRDFLLLDMSRIESDISEFLKLYAQKSMEAYEKAVALYKASLFFRDCFEWSSVTEAYYNMRYCEMLEALIADASEKKSPCNNLLQNAA